LSILLPAIGLTTISQLGGGVPKGYVRVLVFNADSALVSQQTQQLTAAALNNYEPLRLRVVVPQDGYVTAYVGNESEVDVYFDDVTVEHRQGLQVQETQYDPMGLELAGLTRDTPGIKPLNQYKFNGKEFQADLGLNWTQLDWRMVDNQLDILGGVDPEIENGQESMSPYAFGYDNAVRFADPDGRKPGDGWGGVGSGFVTGYVGTFTGIRDAVVSAVHNPLQTLAALPEAYVSAALAPMTMGFHAAVDSYQFAKAMVQGDGTAVGKRLGEAAAQLTVAAATEGAARGLGKVVKTPCGCFVAGTAVSMRRGGKLIEQVQVGDSVWAYNERTRQTALRPVTHLFRYERDTVYVLHTATGEALRTTSDHPFYVRGQWVKVKRLRVGDSLVSQGGQRHVLRRIELKPEHVTVYNFTVDELHTYFVGQNAILVHNSGPCDFVVTRDGTAVSTNLSKVEGSYKNAGFREIERNPNNVIYEVPKADGKGTFYSRLQKATSPRQKATDGDRVVNTRNTGDTTNKDYVNPNGSRIEGTSTKSQRRETGHIHLQR
jgi:hypothetical protein